jgi:hypothetical protein
MLVVWTFGQLWAAVIPNGDRFKGTRLARLAPILNFVNPGPFRIKEHVVSTIIATTASYGSTAVLNFAVQRVRVLFTRTSVRCLTRSKVVL